MRVARILAGVVLAAAGATACVTPPAPPPPVTLADLNGEFAGTSTVDLFSPSVCLVRQIFTAEYNVPNVVKEVELDIDGCTSPPTYDGSVTIDTDAGTLTGSATGTLEFPEEEPVRVELTLVLDSGTGRFRGIQGDVHVSIRWPFAFSGPITGSLTAV